MERVTVKFGNLQYYMEFNSKYMFVDDYSGTGKSTLISILLEENVEIIGNLEFRQIQNKATQETWEQYFEKNNTSDNIVFFSDEGWSFFKHARFQQAVKETPARFLLITRDSLQDIPYAVDDVYSVVREGDVNKVVPIKSTLFEIPEMPENLTLVTEDSGSGFRFFDNRFLRVEKAAGKDNIKQMLLQRDNICCLVDSLGFGANIKDVIKIVNATNNFIALIPSFEGIILNSGFIGEELLFDEKESNKEESCHQQLIKVMNQNGTVYSKRGANMCLSHDCCYKPITKRCGLYKEGDKYLLILGEEMFAQFTKSFGDKSSQEFIDKEICTFGGEHYDESIL